MKIKHFVVLTLFFCVLTINLGCGKKAPPQSPKEILNLNPLFK